MHIFVRLLLQWAIKVGQQSACLIISLSILCLQSFLDLRNYNGMHYSQFDDVPQLSTAL